MLVERDVGSSVGRDEGDGGSYDQVGRMRARKGELMGDGVVAVVDEEGVADTVAARDVVVAGDRVVSVVGAPYLEMMAVDVVGDVVDPGGVDTGVVAVVDRVVSIVGAPYLEVMAVDMVGDVVAAVDNGGVAANVADRDGGVAVDRVVGVVGAPYLELSVVCVGSCPPRIVGSHPL